MDSLDDGDSSSDYVNNTSDEDEEEEEEEDYDEGLPEEDEGVTYYIRYCPEDDSYLEGPADYHGAPEPPPLPPSDTDECQEAVEEWVEEDDNEGEEVDVEVEGGEVGDVLRCEVLQHDVDEQQLYDGRPEPVLDHLPPPATLSAHCATLQEDADTAEHGQDEGEKLGEEYLPHDEEEVEDEEEEEDEEEGNGRGYGGEYYGVPEDNGNSVCVAQYRGPAAGVGEGVVVAGSGGETGGEETEEDIDQIVAEIKMSMSMGSLSSASGSASANDQSPDELAQDPTPASAPYPPEARTKHQPSGSYTSAPHRHDGRPKSLNIPPARHTPDVQRGYKAQQRTPEERQRWAQEQVSAH